MSPLICIANQLTCFYMIQILTEKYLKGISEQTVVF